MPAQRKPRPRAERGPGGAPSHTDPEVGRGAQLTGLPTQRRERWVWDVQRSLRSRLPEMTPPARDHRACQEERPGHPPAWETLPATPSHQEARSRSDLGCGPSDPAAAP